MKVIFALACLLSCFLCIDAQSRTVEVTMDAIHLNIVSTANQAGSNGLMDALTFEVMTNTTDDLKLRLRYFANKDDRTNTSLAAYTFRMRAQRLVEYLDSNNDGYQITDPFVKIYSFPQGTWSSWQELAGANGSRTFAVTNTRNNTDSCTFIFHVSGDVFSLNTLTINPNSIKIDINSTFQYMQSATSLAFVAHLDTNTLGQVQNGTTNDKVNMNSGFFSWLNTATVIGTGAVVPVVLSDLRPSNDRVDGMDPTENPYRFIFSYNTTARDANNMVSILWDPEVGGSNPGETTTSTTTASTTTSSATSSSATSATSSSATSATSSSATSATSSSTASSGGSTSSTSSSGTRVVSVTTSSTALSILSVSSSSSGADAFKFEVTTNPLDDLKLRLFYFTNQAEATNNTRATYTFRLRAQRLVEYNDTNGNPGYQILPVEAFSKMFVFSQSTWSGWTELPAGPGGSRSFRVTATSGADSCSFTFHVSGDVFSLNTLTISPNSIKIDVDFVFNYVKMDTRLALVVHIDTKTLDGVQNGTVADKVTMGNAFFSWVNSATLTDNGQNVTVLNSDIQPSNDRVDGMDATENPYRFIFSFMTPYRDANNKLSVNWDPQVGGQPTGSTTGSSTGSSGSATGSSGSATSATSGTTSGTSAPASGADSLVASSALLAVSLFVMLVL